MVDLNQVDAFLFDMDGTLTDLGKRWWDPFHRAYEKLFPDYDRDLYLSEFEKSVPEVISLATGKSKFLNFRIFWKVTRVMRLSLRDTFRLMRAIGADPTAFQEIELLEDSEKVINSISELGYKLAIVTTASRKTVDNALSQFDLFKKFRTIITRDDVDHIKPDPEGIHKACRFLQIEPSKAVMIGDFPQDVQAGKSAGTRTIGILGIHGKYTKEILEESEPDMMIDSLSDLLQLIPEK